MFTCTNVEYKDILRIDRLTIKSGTVTCIVGESGSGKSTFLMLLNRMIEADRGEISYKGNLLSSLDPIAHRREVAMLPQNPVLFGESIRDNVNAGRRFSGKAPADDEYIKQIMRNFYLSKELETEAETLSGGEKQRLALVRAAVLDSPVLLLDEPTSALDDNLEHEVMDRFVTWAREQRKTIVFVTHSRPIGEAFSDTLIDFNQYTLQGGALDG